VKQNYWFSLIGGLFLCYLGVRAFFKKPHHQSLSVGDGTYFSAFGMTFFLTLTNPMTILFFAGVFAGLGLVNQAIPYTSAGQMVIGVFLGSGSWWLILSSMTGIMRNKISAGKMAWANRISGLIILAFGVAALIRAVAR
jgi:threonine/homoserine/homoserine lactone efflux protein